MLLAIFMESFFGYLALFFNILWGCIILFIALISIFAITMVTYYWIQETILLKNGVIAKFKVKKVEEIGNNLNSRFKILFEITTDGLKKTKTIKTFHGYKVDTVLDGIYYEKKDLASVAGNGIYLSKSGAIITYALCMILLSYSLFYYLGSIPNIFIIVCGIFLVIITFSLFITDYLSSKKLIVNKKENADIKNKTKKEIYNSIQSTNVAAETYNTRYIPRKRKSEGIAGKFIVCLFGCLCILAIIYVSYYSFGFIKRAYIAKTSYPVIELTVSDVDITSERDKDNDLMVYITYNYSVNGETNSYKIHKTYSSESEVNEKIGHTVKVYFNEENPEESLSQTDLDFSTIPFLFSILAWYFIYYIIKTMIVRKKYRTEITEGEKI